MRLNVHLTMSALLMLTSLGLGADAPPASEAASPATRPADAKDPLTARQVVDRIKHEIHVPWSAATVDTFKAGDPDAPITGIVTTHLCTLDVLKKAAASGKNFVITHEPTFYNHQDQIDWLGDDKVLAEKRAFIKSHRMVVFRFHDHWHRRVPDGINEGVLAQFGWEKYVRPGEKGFVDVPPMTLADMTALLKERTGAAVVRAVGPKDMKVSRVGLLFGAAGREAQIKVLQRDDVEVLIIGEAQEWETVEYVRDAVSEGKTKALILLGHANSEEAGMENCARWLKTFITEVPVEFIAAGDPLWTVPTGK